MTTIHAFRFAPALALLVMLPLSAQDKTQGTYKSGWYSNPHLGFKVKVPPKWNRIPLQLDENWIVGKFLSDKNYITKSKDWNWDHKPFMKIIVFKEEDTEVKDKSVEVAGGTTFITFRGVPYQDYRHYLKKNLANGYYFEVEDEGTRGKIKVLKYEVRQDKDERMKKRLIAWVYKAEGMDIAVEFELLADRLDQQRPIAMKVLKSFKLIDRKGAKGKGPTTGQAKKKSKDKIVDEKEREKGSSKLWTLMRSEWRKKTAKERMDRRKEIEKDRFKKIEDRSTEGWEISYSRNFMVVSHADKRYTQQCITASEAMRKWCDKYFDGVSDEYVRRFVLRVCKDADEYRAYRFSSSGSSIWFVSDSREIVTYRDNYHGTSGSDMDFFVDSIVDLYIQDKDPLLYQYMPNWLKQGLSSYLDGAKLKGKKLVFRKTDWAREGMRELERDGKLLDARSILTMNNNQFGKTITGFSSTYQLGSFMEFLIQSKHKLLKDFVKRYMIAIIEVGEEYDKESGFSAKSAETEAEEESRRKEMSSFFKSKREETQNKLNEKMCNFTEKEWKSIERAYAKFNK